MADDKATQIQQRIAERLDPDELAGSRVSTGGGLPAAFMPSSFGELMEFGKLMSVCHGIPAHLRGKPGDCLQVAMQAVRWGMDPFSVANKSYFVNDRMAYEAQLVNAVVYASGLLEGRLQISYEGEGEKLVCIVAGRIKNDPKTHDVRQEIGTITVKNSPLWKQAPRQQLAYYTTREWARLYMPDVLLGVYTPEELNDDRYRGPDNAKDVTPRPRRSDYVNDASDPGQRTDPDEPADFDLIDEVGEIIGTFGPRAFAKEAIERIQKFRDGKLLQTFKENNADQVERLKTMLPDAYQAIQDDAATMEKRLAPEAEKTAEPQSAWVASFRERVKSAKASKAVDTMLNVTFKNSLDDLAKSNRPLWDELMAAASEAKTKLQNQAA